MVVLVILIGLILGSFISALTWRLPRNINILDLKSRSICPKCRGVIAWYDNVPLLSFVFLGGRCRNCKSLISWRYPLIEVSTALGFVAIGYYVTTLQGTTLQGVYSIIIFLILEAIFVIDLEHRIIPDSFVFFGILVSALYLLLYPNSYTLFSNFFAGFISATMFLLIHLFTKGHGMGLGDVKFAVLGGLIVGLRLSLIWLFLAFLTGATVGIILILSKKARLKSQIAFGPFLVFAIPLVVLAGEKILFWLNL